MQNYKKKHPKNNLDNSQKNGQKMSSTDHHRQENRADRHQTRAAMRRTTMESAAKAA